MISPISFYFLGLHRFEDDFTDFVFYFLGLHRFEDDFTDFVLFFGIAPI